MNPEPAVQRVLVVEDDPLINEAVAARLRHEGFAVTQVHDGPAAVASAEAEEPDVVVLDVMLPGFDGWEVCRRIQASRPVPVLMLTARDDEADVLTGLAVGADDYLTKPFRARELVARVRALLRRVERARELADAGTIRRVGDLTLDLGARRLRVGEDDVHLTPTEWELLVVLSERPGQVVTREQLLTQVWGWADPAGSRTLDSHVKGLRSRIGADRIRTSHGVGFALEVIR